MNHHRRRNLTPVNIVFLSVLALLASSTILYAQANPTASDEFDACLENVVARADERATNGEGTTISQFIKFSMDVAHCTMDYMSPFH